MGKSISVFHWLPRIICILAILFISMFALDAFSPGLTLWKQIGDFLIHLIPSYIMIALLVIAWKWEYVGGIIFTVIGFVFCLSVFLLNYNRNHFSAAQSFINTLIVAIPFVLVGILFMMSHNKKKQKLAEESKSQEI
jgi:prolipoprotein diacylglyceryltransferase